MVLTQYTCRRCGGHEFSAQRRGPHIGLYCTYCAAWYKWLSKFEKDLLSHKYDFIGRL